MLSFTLLGQATAYKNGTPLQGFRSKKERALLFYLAHTGQSHWREHLAELLWEERSTSQALSNLRTVLARIRKQVGEALVATRQWVALAPDRVQQVDSRLLLNRLANFGEVDTVAKANALRELLELYQGEFLADFYVRNAPYFNQWVTRTREEIRRQVVAAYQKLVDCARMTDALERGVSDIRRWLEIDEWDEMAHTMLIQLLLESGCEWEACQHYNTCTRLFRAKLGVEPPAGMTALIEGIAPAPPVIRSTRSGAEHNLPVPYDPFFGRVNARQEINARLNQPWCRLITLVGLGGVGKTRLATTIARDQLGRYRDGVWLVNLAGLDSDDPDPSEAIAVEIATTLSLPLSGSGHLAQQLITHMQDKQLLLLLDNYEHLLGGGAEIVSAILHNCDSVQMIVTSREPLGIRGESVFPLSGLRYPDHDRDQAQFDAVDLFLARRAQRRRDVVLEDEMATIRRICEMVEGLPLAIELAAGLTRHLTVQEIETELRQGFDVLETSLRDVPSRHRSLRQVFEMSWRTLSPALQKRLARLAVFEGGFTGQAAQEIADVSRHQMAALHDKSLLARDVVSVRYMLHPVIRAYADEKRSPTDQTPQKHAEYYLALLARHTDALQDPTSEALAKLEPELGNFRRAWQTALDQRRSDLLSKAFTAFAICYQHGDLAREGEAMMQATRRAAASWGADGMALATRAQLEYARYQIASGRLAPAIRTLEEAVQEARQNHDDWAEGLGVVLWGEALQRIGRPDLARQKFAQARALVQRLDDARLREWRYHNLQTLDKMEGGME